jgi:hypothetical protein
MYILIKGHEREKQRNENMNKEVGTEGNGKEIKEWRRKQ